MNNKPFWKKQSFWLNIWVWWVGLGIIQIILLSSGELLSKVGRAVGYLVPFFSSFFSYGEISSLLQNVINEFSLSPERLTLGAIFSLGGIYIAHWYSKKMAKLVQRIFFNIIILIILTFIADFIMFAIPV